MTTSIMHLDSKIKEQIGGIIMGTKISEKKDGLGYEIVGHKKKPGSNSESG